MSLFSRQLFNWYAKNWAYMGFFKEKNATQPPFSTNYKAPRSVTVILMTYAGREMSSLTNTVDRILLWLLLNMWHAKDRRKMKKIEKTELFTGAPARISAGRWKVVRFRCGWSYSLWFEYETTKICLKCVREVWCLQETRSYAESLGFFSTIFYIRQWAVVNTWYSGIAHAMGLLGHVSRRKRRLLYISIVLSFDVAWWHSEPVVEKHTV